jgi:hypothetical protein
VQVCGPVDQYANAFTLTPGRCFRKTTLPGVGHPSHCEEPVAWHGRWRAADNRLYRVGRRLFVRTAVSKLDAAPGMANFGACEAFAN